MTHLYHFICKTLHLIKCLFLYLSSQASRILGIPPVLTEQYPKGLGPTVPELGAEDLKAHTKTSFTMMTEEVEKELQALGNPKQAILCGIEAHACIAVRWQNLYRYYIVIMGFLFLLCLFHMCTINKTMLQFINVILILSTVHNIWPARKRDGSSYCGWRRFIQKVYLAALLPLKLPYIWIWVFVCVETCDLPFLCPPLHSQTDRLFALSRLKQSGAYLTTTEGVLLQLVQDAKHPKFKEVLLSVLLPL